MPNTDTDRELERKNELRAALRDAVDGKACWIPRARKLLRGPS